MGNINLPKNYCDKCNKKSICVSTCKLVDSYINQDWVEQKESVYNNIDDFSDEYKMWVNNLSLEEKSEVDYDKWLIYKFYFIDKLSKMDISRRVKYSRQQIIRIIKDFKDVEDFYLGEPIKYRMLEAHFIDGMSIMDISKELNINDSYIRRIINKYILNVLN
jgi:hypothetical protein